MRSVFQVFLGDQEVCAVLRNLRRHLAAGGRVAFETRNPLVREWEDWRPEKTRERLDIPGVGAVEVHCDIRSQDGPLVTYETHFRFADDDIVVAPDTLRFMMRDELAAFLADAGFTDIAWYGDWDRSPVTPASSEIIVIAG